MPAAEVKAAAATLRSEWAKPKKDLARIAKLISDFKIEWMSLPAKSQETLEMRSVQREVLEKGVQLAALNGDVTTFARQMAQLQALYQLAADLDDKGLESPNKLHMLGLNLMCLLSQNKTADFHMELAPIPLEHQTNSPYVNWPVTLERSLMVGAYKRIFDARGNLPSEFFAPFYEQLLTTVREEIAEGFESAYANGLAKNEAARLLFLEGRDGLQELESLGQRRGWRMSNNRVELGRGGKKEEYPVINAHRHAANLLSYAKEIEKIH